MNKDTQKHIKKMYKAKRYSEGEEEEEEEEEKKQCTNRFLVFLLNE